MLSSLSLFSLCVGMWGILAGVYILAVKEWVFHLGLAFLRSCFVLLYYIFVCRVSLWFLLFPFCRCFSVRHVVEPSGRGSSGRPSFKIFS